MTTPLKVGVFGAGGRMGAQVCAAVAADPALDLVAAVDPARAGADAPGGIRIVGDLEVVAKQGAQVAVDFTVAGAAMVNASWCAGHGVHAVIGTTGLGPEGLETLRSLFGKGGPNCVYAPNFAIGAVLMMRFAELAAPWFDTVEVIELHHDGKVDAPSGTATLTAQRVAAARGSHAGGLPATSGDGNGKGISPARGAQEAPGVRVHSVRLRGLVAHQEVLLGAEGQVLTIRHDSLDRSSFMPGVLLAVKQVASCSGLTVGLDSLLGL